MSEEDCQDCKHLGFDQENLSNYCRIQLKKLTINELQKGCKKHEPSMLSLMCKALRGK